MNKIPFQNICLTWQSQFACCTDKLLIHNHFLNHGLYTLTQDFTTGSPYILFIWNVT